MPHLAHPATPEHLENLVALTQHLAGCKALHPLRHVEGLALALGAGGEVGGARVVSHPRTSGPHVNEHVQAGRLHHGASPFGLRPHKQEPPRLSQ